MSRWAEAPVAASPGAAPTAAVAAVTGTAAVVALLGAGLPAPAAAAGGWLAAVGVALLAVDARTHRLPDRFVAAGAAGVLALLVLDALVHGSGAALGRAVLGAGATTAAHLLLALPRTAGLGLGDVKLAGVLGLWLAWLGWDVLAVGVGASVLLGGAWAGGLILARRARGRDAVAFGPWMVLGAVVATAVHLPLA